ncbi:MAG: hypothetical protein L6Q37_15275 [Bdellovibrionaceae bacterium]|nr:hypothetical protein [Pseudobdellovibrionaceae bacterium]NUM58793.1 hypothetical protein [Pseudobdellovibrionaceae bacterium]
MRDSKKIKHVIRALQIMSLTAVALVIFGNGCSEGGFVPSESVAQSPTQDDSLQCKSPTEIEVIPGAKTASLVGASEVLKQLTNCVGLETYSDATKKVYDDKKGSISTYGAANSITPPMMMAITSIAGEVCSDLIDKEISQGSRIFTGMDLSSSTLPSNSQIGNAISNLALSCWRGNESNEEKAALLDMVNQSVASSETGAARKAALLVCTAMLSSLDSLLN